LIFKIAAWIASKSKVTPDDMVEIARLHSVLPKNAKPLRQLIVVAHDRAGISGGTEFWTDRN
jgi:hypothetical protein